MVSDAVPPTGSPEPGPNDLAYASMEYEWQRAVVRPLAGMLGLPPGTVLFTLALFASVPLGAVFQFIPGAAAKNLYSLVAGEGMGMRCRGMGWECGGSVVCVCVFTCGTRNVMRCDAMRR